MDTHKARRVFAEAIARAAGDPDAVARLEVAREYFTNPQFRSWLNNAIAKATGK